MSYPWIAHILLWIVALEHIFITILEMFFSRSPLAIKIFGLDERFVQHQEYQTLMSNQGLYNGFLAVGLIVSSCLIPENGGLFVQRMFLFFVLVAGIFGGMTAKKSILFTQGGPALLALLFSYL